MSWQKDKSWSDIFIPEIKRILTASLDLFGEAPEREDQEHNTDLIVLHTQDIRVACRIRRFEFVAKYGNQFTIRNARPSGNKTEMAKIMEGWGQFMFYGFAALDCSELHTWVIIDLRPFRKWLYDQMYLHKGVLPCVGGRAVQNKDTSSSFLAFNLDDIPPEAIVARNKSGGE
jgi:hypothetical protein